MRIESYEINLKSGPLLEIFQDCTNSKFIINLRNLIDIQKPAYHSNTIYLFTKRKKEQIEKSLNKSHLAIFSFSFVDEIDLENLKETIFKFHKKVVDCNVSQGICESITFGSGEINEHGYFQYPCYFCARRHEEIGNLKRGTCWPFLNQNYEKEIDWFCLENAKGI